jgi:hypothetical protein
LLVSFQQLFCSTVCQRPHPAAVQALVIKLEASEPEQLRQDVIAAVNMVMNQGWVLLRAMVKV